MTKNIAFFCIPAHGHTNPMLPVAAELVRRGNKVRFYSFDEFRTKIENTGARFAALDALLPEVSEEETDRLKKVSITEMTIQDLRITANLDGFIAKEVAEFKPDVIYSDSVCFWGKLTAEKYNIPLVVSTSTFAFNQFSQQYMKQSCGELMGLICGMPKCTKELKKLEPYGYKVKGGILSLVQNDNQTDSIVYTSKRFQPYAKTFSEHYAFVGPSVFSKLEPSKQNERKLVYISMGTVINDRPDFYKNCIAALGGLQLDVIISCGSSIDISSLGELPENIKVYPRVDQLEVLSRADVFITHCGMNSVSESLYMAAPMLLYPQTSEQHAVARRAFEIGAGAYLKDDSAEGIAEAVQSVIENASYAKAAAECSADFRACSGAEGAADFIENAPHTAPQGNDAVKRLNARIGISQLIYWLIAITAMVCMGIFGLAKYIWILGAAAGVLNELYKRVVIKAFLKNMQ